MDDEGTGNLPLAIALIGVAAVLGFLAFRPWPQSTGGEAIKPGAYLVDVLHAEPPPAGPPTFSSSEVQLTEAGLGALLGLWAAGKAGQAAGSLAQGAGALGGLWSWIKGLGKEAEDTAGDVGDVGAAA